MNDIIDTLFGEGSELNSLQMGCRALVMFFITLALIRIAGMRVFGQKSAFDLCIVIMLGAILSRAVTGASPFFPTTTAGTVMAIIHRVLAIMSVYNPKIGWLLKGGKTILYKDDKMIKKNLILCSISFRDLMEEVRLTLNQDSLENVKEIYMERSGKISIIKKNLK